MKRVCRSPAAFTLIDLLICVSIIMILIAILLPAVSNTRGRACTVSCLSNLRQIGAAVILYANENNDFTPPREVVAANNTGGVAWTPLPGYPNWASAAFSDQVYLGQYCGSTNNDNANPAFLSGLVAVRSTFVCPSDRQHISSGGAVVGSYGMFGNFTTVKPSTGFSHLWRLVNAAAPTNELVTADALQHLMAPGSWSPPYPFYGQAEPILKDSWNLGASSNYDWAIRHNGGCNILLLDGHAEWASSIKAGYNSGQFQIHFINE